MGEIIHIDCAECKKGKEYYIGTGWAYSFDRVFCDKKPMIFDIVKDKMIISEIKNKLNEGAIPGNDYTNDIYYCNKCKTIDVKFYFCFYEKGEIATSVNIIEKIERLDFSSPGYQNLLYEPKYKCKSCKTEMKRIDRIHENGEMRQHSHDFIEKLEKLDMRCKRCGGKALRIYEVGFWH
jgi:hypothetical protein